MSLFADRKIAELFETRRHLAGLGPAILACLLATSSAPAADPANIAISSAAPFLRFNDLAAPAYSWTISPDNVAFTIRDTTHSDTPVFLIRPNAPANSIYLDSIGQVGLGTSTPSADIHIKSSFAFASLRLEGSGGGKWDLEGDSSTFAIVDSNNFNAPFLIWSGAPSASLAIDPSGNVGIGTTLPHAPLHVEAQSIVGNEPLAVFHVYDDAYGQMTIDNASSTNNTMIPRLKGRSSGTNAALIMEGVITTDSGNSPAIVYNAIRSIGGQVNRPLVVYRNNDVPKATIAGNGNITATAFINASSRDLKDKITDLSSAKAAAALRQLTPVEFVYNDDVSADPRIGFIAEDVPDLIAEPERKSVPVMDVLALVTRVVKDQQQTIDAQKEINEVLMQRIKQLEETLRDKE